VDLRDLDLIAEEVRTDRLLLRPPRRDDEDAVFRACQDPEILRWTVSLPDPYTRADAEAWVRDIAPTERAEGRGLAFVVETDGELVGSAGLTFRSSRPGNGPEVGYWIAPWARRRGYATEATRALVDWAFEHGADRVRLLTVAGNTASQAVARNAGFRAHDVVPDGLVHPDGHTADAAVFVREREC
jgi:RimJ/RimL family protein N-acetyltransferase